MDEDELLTLECHSCGKTYSLPWVDISLEKIEQAHRMHKAIAHDNPAYPTAVQFDALSIVTRTVSRLFIFTTIVMIGVLAYRILS